jgi:hypothetical protein
MQNVMRTSFVLIRRTNPRICNLHVGERVLIVCPTHYIVTAFSIGADIHVEFLRCGNSITSPLSTSTAFKFDRGFGVAN